MSRKIITCRRCKKTGEMGAHGLCLKCYKSDWDSGQKPSESLRSWAKRQAAIVMREIG